MKNRDKDFDGVIDVNNCCNPRGFVGIGADTDIVVGYEVGMQ